MTIDPFMPFDKAQDILREPQHERNIVAGTPGENAVRPERRGPTAVEGFRDS